MDYEKAYKEALERAKDFQKVNGAAGSAVISEIFPELAKKEDKDEKIRKNCIHFLELQKSHHAATFEIEECIDWLEKQKTDEKAYNDGKQEVLKAISKDNLEPKFKVGDWIFSPQYGTARIIGTVISDANVFLLEYLNDNHEYIPIEYVNSTFDKWTIQDAKDGDVLVLDDIIMIFKSIKTVCTANTYVLYCDGIFFDDWCDFDNNAHPATKEQRDFLFQKMKEAGYEWDADKKELKEIKHL